jgi:EpsI family protein
MKGRLSPALLAALVCAVAGLVVFGFWGNPVRGYIDTRSLFLWWGWQWANPGSETEHGWLILALSAWLLWRNLHKGERPMPGGEGERAGPASGLWHPAGAAMVGGLALHVVGFAAQQTRISIVAVLVFAWGVLRLGGGRRWGAAAAFPLGFLVFAIPINVLDSVGFWLRVWVVDASAAIARGAGIAVLRSGTLLLAPDGAYNYDVAAACSGVRSLTALAALSLLTGYLNFRTNWRRAAVLLLCLPLVYAGNVTRILAIIFAAEAGGPRWGDLAHEAMGYGVFLIVLGGVMGGVALLRRWAPEPAFIPAAPAGAAGSDGSAPGRRGRPAWAVAVTVGAAAAGVAFFLGHLERLPARGQVGVRLAADGVNPVELPAFLGTEWIGRRTEVTAVEREILPPDTGYSRKLYVAVADPRRQVFLSVVLSGRDRTSIHRPELCLVGQGWTMVEQARHRFVAGGGVAATLLRVRREVRTPRGGAVVPQLVAYWFVNGDGVVATHAERLWRDACNRVLRGRADRWAYVLVQTDATDGEAAALARMETVLAGTVPVLVTVKTET